MLRCWYGITGLLVGWDVYNLTIPPARDAGFLFFPRAPSVPRCHVDLRQPCLEAEVTARDGWGGLSLSDRARNEIVHFSSKCARPNHHHPRFDPDNAAICPIRRGSHGG
jgi:hypothetical protein